MHRQRAGFEAEGSVACAAPSRQALKHPNSGLIAPLWHGEQCQGLSGLYAILNGIRLAVAHEHCLTASEMDGLLRVGVRFLDGRLTLQQTILNGLRIQLWRQLIGAMAEATRSSIGVRVVPERLHAEPKSAEAAFDALEDAVCRWRVPLILCRGGHYTALSGVTASSLLLFDSGGGCWISKRVCGVPGDGEALRHAIYPASFMALNV
jgi:hypothetical protein